MKRGPQIIALLFVGVLALAGYMYFSRGGEHRLFGPDDINLDAAAWDAVSQGTDTSDDGSTGNSENYISGTRVISAGPSGTQIAIDAWAVYENGTFGFMLRHPPDFSFTQFGETGGDMVLAQGQGDGRSFQIFVTPWDEPLAVMTPERIRRDIPDMSIREPQTVALSDGVKALIFYSNDPSLGDLREVWIIHDGLLYQITAPAQLDAELATIMGQWKFLW